MAASHKQNGKAGASKQRQLAAAGRRYTCRQCDKTFGSFQALGGHSQIHITLPCPQCGLEYNGLALRGHLQLHRFIDQHNLPPKIAAYLYAKAHGFTHHK